MYNLRRPDLPQHLTLDGNILENWQIFKTSFERYSDQVHINMLLICLGKQCDEIISELHIAEAKDYKTVIAKLDEYFVSRKVTNDQQEIFNERSQKLLMNLHKMIEAEIDTAEPIQKKSRAQCRPSISTRSGTQTLRDLKCYCSFPVNKHVASNIGPTYFTCPNAGQTSCGFFKTFEDVFPGICRICERQGHTWKKCPSRCDAGQSS